METGGGHETGGGGHEGGEGGRGHGGRRITLRQEEYMVEGRQILTGSFDLLLGGLVPHVADSQNCIVILILDT